VGQGSGDLWQDIVPRVDAGRCRRCAECPAVTSCLANAFRRPDPNGLPVVDEGYCFGCYSCAGACPHGAILLPRLR
jgi:carbon-monoxide dehydrogenase iron sulfur subunit